MNRMLVTAISSRRLIGATVLVILAGGTNAHAASATATASARILTPGVQVAVDRVPATLTVHESDTRRGYVEFSSGLDRKRWEPSNQAYQVSMHVQAPGLTGAQIVNESNGSSSDIVRVNLEDGSKPSADGSITLIYHNF